MSVKTSPVRWFGPLVVGLLLLAGCEKDEIRTYTVPKPPPEVYEEKVRLMAAIFTTGEKQWFIKLLGPIDEVTRQQQAFTTFLGSIRFPDEDAKPIAWTLPADWTEVKGSGLRFATIYPGPKGKTPEIGVFQFPKSSLLSNINRWCDLDLGRRKIRQADVEKYARNFKAGEESGILVDMTGPGSKRGKGMKDHPPIPAGGSKPLPRPGKNPLTYKVPEGWKDTGPRSTFGITILATFEVREGDHKAEVQVTPLAGGVGGLLDNVNRWRKQVGLAEVSQAELDRNPPQKVTVGGQVGSLLDLSGTSLRMLVATVKQGGRTWYFKMLGPTDVVGKNRPKFEAFLQSVQFTGASDE